MVEGQDPCIYRRHLGRRGWSSDLYSICRPASPLWTWTPTSFRPYSAATDEEEGPRDDYELLGLIPFAYTTTPRHEEGTCNWQISLGHTDDDVCTEAGFEHSRRATIDTLVLLVVAVLGLLMISHVKLLLEVAALLDGDDSLVACVQTTNNLRELGTTRLNRY
jgi:hypothetical protein